MATTVAGGVPENTGHPQGGYPPARTNPFQNQTAKTMNATQGELMERNLDQVMNQRDPAKRRAAIQTIYAADATFYEVDAVVTGYDAVNAIVQSVLDKLPPEFVFHATKPAMEHHNVGRLSWGLGPAGGPAVITGTDVVLFKEGRIQALYVFLDPTGA